MTTSPEQAQIDKYLLFLEDPSSIVDEKAIKAAEKQVESAGSPSLKLIALANLRKLKAGDGADVLKEFLSVAKKWGAENGITPDEWKALKVPTDVIAQIAGGAAGTRRASGPVVRTSPEELEKAYESIRAAITAQTGEFTKAEILELAGGQSAWVDKIIKEQLSAKKIVEAGKRKVDGVKGPGSNLYKLK